MAHIKGEDRRQITFFPEVIDDYVNEDNPVRVLKSIDWYVDRIGKDLLIGAIAEMMLSYDYLSEY